MPFTRIVYLAKFLALSLLLPAASGLCATAASAQTCAVAGNVLSCLEVTNDLTTARTDEVAFSGVAIAASANLLTTDQLEVVRQNGPAVAAQFRVLARWGGALGNAARPIRWLEVAIQDPVAAGTTNTYQLRQTATPATPPAGPLTVTDQGGGLYLVDTGAATFGIDAANPALLRTVTVGADTLYTHTPGAGPRLEIADTVLDTAAAGEMVVDAGSFRVLESEPLKASFATQGHFVDPTGNTLCDDYTPDISAYEALGFTAVLTFTRGTRHVDFLVEIRNECLDAQFGPFPSGQRTLQRASWELPLSIGDDTGHGDGMYRNLLRRI